MSEEMNGFVLERRDDSWIIAGYEGSEKDLAIPSHIDNMPVALIATDALEGNSVVESVEVPETITFVGNQAFAHCTSLRRAVFRGKLENLNLGTFLGCTSLVEVELPEGLSVIGQGTFRDCTSLTTISLPPTVTRICDRAFADCTSLRTIVVPESVDTIERSAFRGCSSLSSLTVHDSLTYIGPRAFQDCPLLKSVTILGDRPRTTVEAFFNNHSMAYLVADHAIKMRLESFEDAKKLMKSELAQEQVFAARVLASYPDRLGEVPLKQKMAKLLASDGCTDELRAVADIPGYLPKPNLQSCIEIATANGHTETAAYLLDLLTSLDAPSPSDLSSLKL